MLRIPIVVIDVDGRVLDLGGKLSVVSRPRMSWWWWCVCMFPAVVCKVGGIAIWWCHSW